MAADRIGDQTFGACANCREPFEPGVTYPVETREGRDGDLQLYSFCDEECLEAWMDDD